MSAREVACEAGSDALGRLRRIALVAEALGANLRELDGLQIERLEILQAFALLEEQARAAMVLLQDALSYLEKLPDCAETGSAQVEVRV